MLSSQFKKTLKKVGSVLKSGALPLPKGEAHDRKAYKGLYSKNPKRQAKAANDYFVQRVRRDLLGTHTYNDGTPMPAPDMSKHKNIPGVSTATPSRPDMSKYKNVPGVY